MKKRIPFIIGAIIVTAFIFGNSMKDAVASTVSSGRIVNFVIMILEFFKIKFSEDLVIMLVRKTAHITEFFAQAVLVSNCFYGKYKNRIIYILFIGLFTACIDEFLQLFSNGRSGMVVDIFIDFLGTNLGMLLCAFAHHFRRRRRC